MAQNKKEEKLRPRKKIEKIIKTYPKSRFSQLRENIRIELLLDIREILSSLSTAILMPNVTIGVEKIKK